MTKIKGSSFLSELNQLSGRTVYTLSRNRPFAVVSVDMYEAEIRVQSTGKSRRVPLTEIETAWRSLHNKGELTRAEIQEHYSPRNPAYVAAMLAAMPGVSYVSKPVIRLRYEEGG